MHTTFYKNVTEHKEGVKVMISKENYQKLVGFIQGDFQIDETKKFNTD